MLYNKFNHGEHVDWNILTCDGGELESGNYYLTENIILTQNITIGGEVALCLNGYMLAGNGNGAVITVSGGTLNLCDCNSSNNSHQFYVTQYIPLVKLLTIRQVHRILFMETLLLQL